MQNLVSYSSIFFVLWLSLCVADSRADEKPSAPKRPVIGWVEKVQISPGLLLHAKIDTASSVSSVHATDIKEYKVKKKRWVKFTLTDRYGHQTVLDRKVMKSQKLKGSDGQKRSTLTVQLGLCIGNRYIEDEIGLADRSDLEQELKIGRQTIEGEFAVDPALTFTLEPECAAQKKNG